MELSKKLTERSKRVIALAKLSAGVLNQDVGAEHILMGLIEEGSGLAAYVLGVFEVTKADVLNYIKGKDAGTGVMTPGAELAVRTAVVECEALGGACVGTEHMLLGVLIDPVVIAILFNRGVTVEKVRQEISDLLRPDNPEAERNVLREFVDDVDGLVKDSVDPITTVGKIRDLVNRFRR